MTEDYQGPTPPPELRRLWAGQAQRMDPHDPVAWMQHVSAQAARWGADTELEACCEWVRDADGYGAALALRAARRPKPLSLAEEAQAELDRLIALIPTEGALAMAEPIRRALERLQELEGGND